jgi:hypothetical protein
LAEEVGFAEGIQETETMMQKGKKLERVEVAGVSEVVKGFEWQKL